MKKKPKIICVTGGIGAGKTLIARLFHEHFGIPVYNADEEAKKIMYQPDVKEKLIKLFGEEAYIHNTLNTKYIADIVFNDKEMLKKLEKTVHPEVKKHFGSWVKSQKSPYVILENAILFKSKMDDLCDQIIWVDAPEELRIQRVMHRNNISRAQVIERIKNQPVIKSYLKNIDYLIMNNNSIEKVLNEIITLHNLFTK